MIPALGRGASTHRRQALLLGCGSFADPSLPALRSPEFDVRALAAVLADSQGSRYNVSMEINRTSRAVQVAIDRFFASARPADSHLLYFSCHGIQDARGDLYFAFADTLQDLLSSTAVAAEWVRARMQASRSRSVTVLVDCCFSGAFLHGMRARSGTEANVQTLIRDLPEGVGVTVLTASGSTELSLEDSAESSAGPAGLSYFTEAVVTGIGSGAADRNGDGRVTADELYDYVYEHVVAGPSPQRPRMLRHGEGTIVVAEVARHGTARPASPPPGTVMPPAQLAVDGLLGSVSFDGEWVTLTKNGLGPVMKGVRRLHIRQIAGVSLKPATRLYHGYIQFVVPGITPAPVARFGAAAGRPPMEDRDSLSFRRKANREFVAIQKAVEAAIVRWQGG